MIYFISSLNMQLLTRQMISGEVEVFRLYLIVFCSLTKVQNFLISATLTAAPLVQSSLVYFSKVQNLIKLIFFKEISNFSKIFRPRSGYFGQKHLKETLKGNLLYVTIAIAALIVKCSFDLP